MEDYQDPIASEEELRELAEDIVRYCPSLTQLLLAMGSRSPLDSVSPKIEPLIVNQQAAGSRRGWQKLGDS